MGFCFLDPLEELSILGNTLFRNMSVQRVIGLGWETCSYIHRN